MIARYLLDTSAAARMTNRGVADEVAPLMAMGVVGTCATLDAEVLWSARSPAEYEHLRKDRRTAFEYLPTDDEQCRRALDAQRTLAATGRHRSVGFSDLLIATIAERHHLAVLHYDADFEIAATVLDFAHVWVAERGSL
jgi:predicted nucleic acid-binding protein